MSHDRIDPAAPAPGRTIPVIAGGVDLFRIALTAYGSALEWTTIAQANGLYDPWPAADATPEALIIPRRDVAATGTGGILGAP